MGQVDYRRLARAQVQAHLIHVGQNLIAKHLIYRWQGHQRYRRRPSPGGHRSVPVADRIHTAEHICRQRQVQKAHHRGNANFSLPSPRGSMFPASILLCRRALKPSRRQSHRGTSFRVATESICKCHFRYAKETPYVYFRI